MAFSISGGLHAMGGAIAQSAGTMLLEQQKAELDQQRIELADRLAGVRESAGRKEAAAYNEAASATAFERQGLINSQQNEAAGALADRQSANRIKEDVAAGKAATANAVEKVKALSTPDMLAAQRAISRTNDSPNMSLQVDAETGQAMILDANTGKAKPVMGEDGKPISFQNPAAMQTVTAQISALSQQRISVMDARRQEIDAAKVLYKDDAEEGQKAIDQITARTDALLNDLNVQYASIVQSLQKKSGTAPPSSSRPPLSSFAKPSNPVGVGVLRK